MINMMNMRNKGMTDTCWYAGKVGNLGQELAKLTQLSELVVHLLLLIHLIMVRIAIGMVTKREIPQLFFNTLKLSFASQRRL